MVRARFCLAIVAGLLVVSPTVALTVVAEPLDIRAVPVVAASPAIVPAVEPRGLTATETMVMLLGSVVFSLVLLSRKLD
jgi:hypothetical protein